MLCVCDRVVFSGPSGSERRTRTWRSHARLEFCTGDLRRLGKPLVNPAESTPNKTPNKTRWKLGQTEIDLQGQTPESLEAIDQRLDADRDNHPEAGVLI